MPRQILDCVTITGADDNTDPEELVTITKRFPWVEWGILLSPKDPKPRYPSLEWISKLFELKHDAQSTNLQFSGHICGRWVREICAGKSQFAEEHPDIWSLFARIQLNFSPFLNLIREREFLDFLQTHPKQYIFQLRHLDADILQKAREAGSIIVSPFFDRSGGQGVLPEEWPAAPDCYFGVGGGLAPDNVVGQLEKIEPLIRDQQTIWIDTETYMRSLDGRHLDMKRVVEFLEAAEPWANCAKRTT